MRMMVRATFPVDVSNKAFREQRIAPLVQSIMEDLKPESAYFYAENGRRACMMVFDMQDASDYPRIAEPFFLGMDAHLEVFPVMNADDLMKGMPAAMALVASTNGG